MGLETRKVDKVWTLEKFHLPLFQMLYNVTMFKKTLDAFKTNARERKFIVR